MYKYSIIKVENSKGESYIIRKQLTIFNITLYTQYAGAICNTTCDWWDNIYEGYSYRSIGNAKGSLDNYLKDKSPKITVVFDDSNFS